MDSDQTTSTMNDTSVTVSTSLSADDIGMDAAYDMKAPLQNSEEDIDDLAPEMIVASHQTLSRSDSMEEMVVSSQPDSEGMAGGPRPACQVCGDYGSGYHYSVYSCEGCKGFFKRSVQKNLAYSCKENQTCSINKYSRNSCQYCRYKKCMEVGMKREAVREDRTPGGQHRHKRFRTENSGSDSQPVAPIQQLVITEEPLDQDLLQRIIEAKPDLIPQSDEPDASSLSADQLMQYGYMELRFIIEWARKIPGFQDLAIEDQMQLLKSSFMELNVLRLSFRSLEYKDAVKFADTIILSADKVANIGFGADLLVYTLDFVSRLREISIDHTEFCILNAIVLTYPDAPGIKDRDTAYKLQCKMLDLLRRYSLSTYPWQPRRYGKILLRLPALRTVSAKAAERFLSMTLDGSVRMNALVLEIMS